MTGKLKLFLIALLVSAIGAGVGFYLWNKPHENLSDKKADFTMPAAQLFDAFVKDETSANTTYIQKVVEVSGTVQEITPVANGDVNVLLKEGINASFVAADADAAKALKQGQTATLRGECAGSTIMMGMGEVNISRAVVIK